jgi:hypothetical protein
MQYVIKAARIDNSAEIGNTAWNYVRLDFPDSTYVDIHLNIMHKYLGVANYDLSIPSAHRMLVITYIYGGSITVDINNWFDLFRLASHVKLESLIGDLMIAATELGKGKLAKHAFMMELPCVMNVLHMFAYTAADPEELYKILIDDLTMFIQDIVIERTDDMCIDKLYFELTVRAFLPDDERMDKFMLARTFKWVDASNVARVRRYCKDDILIMALINLQPNCDH